MDNSKIVVNEIKVPENQKPEKTGNSITRCIYLPTNYIKDTGIHVTIQKDGRVTDDSGYSKLPWSHHAKKMGLTIGAQGTIIFIPDKNDFHYVNVLMENKEVTKDTIEGDDANGG